MTKMAKPVLLTAGGLAMLAGIIWMAQGSGYFPYPASSFMINQTPWIYYGAATALGGLIAVLLSRRV